MQLQFQGAARTVTGSMHVLTVNGKTILLDCGTYHGRRDEARKVNENFPFDPASVYAVVLSHAHIDHSGNLPTLVKQGFRGPIYCTRATKSLCEVMLRDSGFIQEEDADDFNRKKRKKGEPPVEPIYTQEDVEETLKQFVGFNYQTTFEVSDGIEGRFADAGHILGSASCHLRCEENGLTKTIVFTGDVGVEQRPILRDPAPPRHADVLISESTYGDRLHQAPPDEEELLEIVQTASQRGGKILIPAFAVGRTQHIVYRLNQLFNEGRLPSLPIFVDSPLAFFKKTESPERDPTWLQSLPTNPCAIL